MRTKILAALTVGLLLAPPYSWGADAKSDKEKLQGVWQCVSGEVRGKPSDKENLSKWIFDGDVLRVKMPGKEEAKGTYKLDTDKDPPQLDVTWESGAEDDNGKTRIAIYSVEGDALKLCFAMQGKTKRPTVFVTAPDSESVLHVYKREKP